MIQVGTVLYGFCGGHFGMESHGDKRVEAMGVDWIVARERYGDRIYFCDFQDGWSISDLEEYTEEPDYDKADF